ncbi:hypothetical protein BRADI_1g58692v3 [Brachypodium distachyon]|uniref:Uncharacterized protein n=1 Tax=Brachypodium distachyon TaxID=15368 RepID=A0A2K2DSB5_BRADI|nr:hypothetical protein BRADI_1g58692v3 [Brachypodium distachyon]
MVSHWTGVAATLAPSFASIDEWWDASLPHTDRSAKRRMSGHLIYVWWNAWKERNRRIFNLVRLTYVQVAHLALEDINQRRLAFGLPAVGFALEPELRARRAAAVLTQHHPHFSASIAAKLVASP